MGFFGLWSFIRPIIVEADGFRFTYFHFESIGMRVALYIHASGGLSNLVLKEFCEVCYGGLELVLIYKVLYFRVVLLGLEYDEGISFVGCGDHGIIFFEFVLNRFHVPVFRLVVTLWVGFVLKF